MLPLKFDFSKVSEPNILCLGAHCDDIEIGCGGTIIELLSEKPSLSFHWVVLSGNEIRISEANKSADRFLKYCKKKHIIFEQFRDSFFPYNGGAIKEFFKALQKECNPDIIFTHHRNDYHQDHRLVSELTWNTFRDHLILEYEIPKWDGDLGNPNLFVKLNEYSYKKKLSIIMNEFGSQTERDWFSAETFSSLMRIRGMECRSPSGYAEAFHCKKASLI